MEAALTNRGFAVTLVDDGFAALEMISQNQFDVVVLDYHMPLLDGVGAARRINTIWNKTDRPRLIGVSADPNGLETRDQNGQLFDAIVQKPVNIPALLHVIETSLDIKRDVQRNARLRQAWTVSGLDHRPRARFVSQPSPGILDQVGDAFDLSRPENPDCVLLACADDAERMGLLRTEGNLFALPAIDIGNGFGRLADAAFQLFEAESWQDVAACLRDFAGRRLMLTQHFQHPADMSEQLLAYIFVSGRNFCSLMADQDGEITYPGFFPAGEVQAATAKLVDGGFLKRLRRTNQGAAATELVEFALTDKAIGELTGTPPIVFS